MAAGDGSGRIFRLRDPGSPSGNTGVSSSFFRRLVHEFLSLVTPPRRDEYLLTPGADAWAMDDGERDEDEDWFGDALGRHLPTGVNVDDARRLGYWPGQEHRPDFVRAWQSEGDQALERPWNYRWDRLSKRSAGPGFSREDYRDARVRAQEIARETLGEDLWQQLELNGYLDVRSSKFPGVTYRLRVGRRIQVLCDPGVEPPWYYDFLCINPAYPLPEYEFFAQLYLYVRDQEDEVVKVAAPQPWDQALGRTF